MDYEVLAEKFLQSMFFVQKSGPQKKIAGSMRGETFVLNYIYLHGGNVVPGEISDTMGISSARIAATLNSLEKKGFITRQIDTNDRRRVLVELTQAGKDTAEQHRQSAVEDTAKMLNLLGEHDAKEYVRITGRLAELILNNGNA